MFKSTLLALALIFSCHGYAEEMKTPTDNTQTTMKVEDAAGTKNKVDGDIDQTITNAKLRADSGSKSKFSLSTKTSYTGGSIDNAFGQKRPALSSDPANQTFTSLDLGLNARYRWTKNDSMTLGTAFGFVTPFQGRVNKGQNAINFNDPSLGYSRVGKLGDFQTVSTLAYAAGTSIPSLAQDLKGQIGAAFNMMYPLQNGVAVGASVSSAYNIFYSNPSNDKNTRTTIYGHDKRSEYDFKFFPQAEYKVNSQYSFRTLFGYFNWRHLYGDPNHYRMLQTYVYQSVGVGISVTRDIYLYPNIQFLPGNMRSDYTNVSLSGTINVF